jgi:hypothetical protein
MTKKRTVGLIRAVIAPFVLGLVLTGMTIGGYTFNPVAVRKFTVNAGATTSTWTVPNLQVGNALHAYFLATAEHTTNTGVTSAYCGTAGTVTVAYATTVATTGTYCLEYIPGR